MTKLELQQQKEIARLQEKIKNLSAAYEKAASELNSLKKESHILGHRGRPPVDESKKARVLSLYARGLTMQDVADEVDLAVGTVHKIISNAELESRNIYIFMDRDKPATLLDVRPVTHRIDILNLTDDVLSRAFGILKKPGWNDYTDFLEERSMPRARYGIKDELNNLGLNSYDAFQITEKTEGRVYGDGQWIRKMDKSFSSQYDLLKKNNKDASEKEIKRNLLDLLDFSGGLMAEK